jgi:hypothetical protein
MDEHDGFTIYWIGWEKRRLVSSRCSFCKIPKTCGFVTLPRVVLGGKRSGKRLLVRRVIVVCKIFNLRLLNVHVFVVVVGGGKGSNF